MIIFDLDDTLIQTSLHLIPQASERACEAMVDAGLNASTVAAETARREHILSGGEGDALAALTLRFGVRPGSEPGFVLSVGHRAFYQFEPAPEDIQCFPKARQVLSHLGRFHRLVLVSSGHEPTQRAKLEISGLGKFFDAVRIVPAEHSKQPAFRDIMLDFHMEAECILCVGDRLDREIADAGSLGMRTCLFRHGEYGSRVTKSGQMHFIIHRLDELISICAAGRERHSH